MCQGAGFCYASHFTKYTTLQYEKSVVDMNVVYLMASFPISNPS